MSFKKITLGIFLFIVSGCFGRVYATPQDDYAQVLTKIAEKKGVQWKLYNAPEKEKLKNYLNEMAKPESLPTQPKDQMAFWLNAYNACVLKILSEQLPVEDVMKVSGFRDKMTCKIAGIDRTLIDIQSGVIRPQFKDPKLHFGMWWGVKGGPSLLNIPYEGKTLDQQIAQQITDSFQNRNLVDFSTKPPAFSPLFDWFKSDFGNSNEAVLKFIETSVTKDQVKLLPKKFAQVKFSAFDWKLDQAH